MRLTHLTNNLACDATRAFVCKFVLEAGQQTSLAGCSRHSDISSASAPQCTGKRTVSDMGTRRKGRLKHFNLTRKSKA
jgi:hypothetical protein